MGQGRGTSIYKQPRNYGMQREKLPALPACSTITAMRTGRDGATVQKCLVQPSTQTAWVRHRGPRPRARTNRHGSRLVAGGYSRTELLLENEADGKYQRILINSEVNLSVMRQGIRSADTEPARTAANGITGKY
jgi:hypothetical protein